MNKIYTLIEKIPKGKVSTYKAVSMKTGIHPRAVGIFLHKNPDPERIPCYKIVRSDGSLGGYSGGIEKKKKLLEKDGVMIKNGKIDLKKYGHFF